MAKTQYYTASSIDGFIADADNALDWLEEADSSAGSGSDAGSSSSSNADAGADAGSGSDAGSSSSRADDSGAAPFETFFAGTGAFAMGATTYEWVLNHENLLDHPQKWQQYYGDVPSWVFTHRELPPIPGARLTFVSGDVRPVHAAMTAAAAGRNIWIVGGGELAGAFADASLLDEVIIGIAPVTLGAGAPLLPRRLTSKRLTLTGLERRGPFAYLTYALSPASTQPPTGGA
jgi:dihydrofolate reductase